MFSWIPIHTETATQLLATTNPQPELLSVLRAMEQQGLTVISLKDHDANGNQVPLGEIDPLTFLASFNRGITDEKRRANWGFLKKRWTLHADVPLDFDGIPVVNNMKSWFFPYTTVTKTLAASYTDKGRVSTIRTINLNQPWQVIHKDLLALVA